jgi:phosphinothricin acetyltransferase
MKIAIRHAGEQDAAAIARIYNEGIEDRGATFETELRTAGDIGAKLAERERYPLFVITEDDAVLGGRG